MFGPISIDGQTATYASVFLVCLAQLWIVDFWELSIHGLIFVWIFATKIYLKFDDYKIRQIYYIFHVNLGIGKLEWNLVNRD